MPGTPLAAATVHEDTDRVHMPSVATGPCVLTFFHFNAVGSLLTVQCASEPRN
jgi:hypothetical protein